MVDFIIVGYGLAGLAFATQLEKEDKSYIVFENHSQQSSRVAGGLYNPVILKRFTAAWQAEAQMGYAVPFYKHIETILGEHYLHPMEVVRRFNSVEEQNTWFEACDKPILEYFLAPQLQKNNNPTISAPYQFGKVKHTGRVQVKEMLAASLARLAAKEQLQKASFVYEDIVMTPQGISYQGINARHILFAEGYGVLQNPFFQHLPLQGNKGEYLIIRSTALQLKRAVKSSIFIIPLGNDYYKIGATYNSQDKTPVCTEAAKTQLLTKLEAFMTAPYEVVGQEAGIRPTVRDRRPLVGTHPKHKNVHILNGLGSRGILIAPSVSQALYDTIMHGEPLDAAIDISRFQQ